MSIITNFVKSYTDKSYQHTTTVSHKGQVIAFAIDEHRRIHYSILDLDSAGTNTTSTLDVNYWPNNPKELQFPNEIARVGYATLPNIQLPIFKKGTRTEAKPGTLRPEEVDPFLSTTARFTADAHFQVLSDGKFIYVFRQSIDLKHEDMLFSTKDPQKQVPLVHETLLLDRFVLSGSELQPKMEVRYQRSRHKYNPQTNKDGLGAKDLEKRSFFEPTQELNFINNLTQGRFTVLLLPTQIADLERWQIFSHNSKTDQIDSFNIERSKDGLFNTKGTQLYTSPDPQYQRSVLERQPGTDSFTGEPLIPLISKSGYAEFALEFDGKNTVVELPETPPDLFNQFTIETWVYFDDFPSYSRIIEFGNSQNTDNIILTNQASSNDLLFCFRGSVQQDLLVKDILEVGQWAHLAVSFDRSGSVVLYKNGIIIGKAQFALPPSVTRKRNYLGKGNWNDPLLDGKIDEVRIWQRARTQTEIQADMNHRLVGNEPGLYSYWRFDEGKGNQLRDQTDNANHATMIGGTWVQSDAPIGDHPGIRRTSFRVQSAVEPPTQRTIQSGLSALLYHQQEKAATGYDQQEKPVKRNARVMLTFATQEANNSKAEKPFVAALDFGISREGKLSQVPDQVALPKLQSEASAKQDLDAISRLQEEVTGLTANINQLEEEIALLMAAVPKISSLEAQKAQLEANIKSLTAELNTKQQDLFNYFFRIQRAGTSNYFQSDGSGNCSDQPLNNNEPGQLWRIFPGYSGTQKFCPANHLNTNSGRFYKGQERGLIHDGSLKVDDWWYQVAGQSHVKHVSSNTYECSIGRSFKQNWTLTKTDRALPVIADLESRIKTSKTQLEAVITELEDLYRKNQQLTEKQSQLALLKIKLDNKQTELELMQAGIQGEVALPMPWLHTDPFGLTVAGGLLNFAYTKDTPLLVGSATGKVTLYFRGVDDQFFVAYYDTNAAKAQYGLTASVGKVLAIARTAEPECDHAQLTIEDSATPDTCTLTIHNPITGLKEIWQNLPRDVEQFTATLNGYVREPIFIGTIAEATGGAQISQLTLKQNTKQLLTQGNILSLYGGKVTVAQTMVEASGEIAINPETFDVPAETPVYLIPYDYAEWTSSNRTIQPLSHGSLQFSFRPENSQGQIQNGTVSGGDATRSCQWIAESPGRALAFDGEANYVTLENSGRLSQLQAPGDLTLESWIRPAQIADTARIIHHHSDESKYTLGIKSESVNAMSAFEFDGVDDYIEFPVECMPTGQEVTVSFWAFGGSKTPCQTSIFASAIGDQRTINIHLPWDNGIIYFDAVFSANGSYERIEKKCDASIFKGVWSHWAFTKNANTGEMKIYLNGQLWHEGKGMTKPFPKPDKVYLGCYTNKSCFYPGKLDEVRIWNKARSQAEIQQDMNKRLNGDEPGLMACWRFTDGIAKDYSPNGYDGIIHGKPTVAPSVMKDNYIRSFVGVNSLFYQSKELASSGQWNHVAAVYNQSYALKFRGNGSLACDHNPTLDLDRDLTIEAFLQVDNFSQTRGILTKGKFGDGTRGNVPYSLSIETDGKITFAFEDKTGAGYIYKSNTALEAGKFYKIAVTRQHQIETKNQGTSEAPQIVVSQWADIRFYINQKEVGYHTYKDSEVDCNTHKLEIGKIYRGSSPSYFAGCISEVRCWNAAVPPRNLGDRLNGGEKGLIAWWRFEENDGNIAGDSKGDNHLVITAAQWVKSPDPQGSSLTIYQNGIPVPIETIQPKEGWGKKQFTLGGIVHETGGCVEPFAGTLEEARIWKVARTQEQIQDNLFGRIKGEKQDLIAYYTFDQEHKTQLLDHSLFGNSLALGSEKSQPMSVLSTAPISNDTAIIRSALAGVKTQFHDTIHSCPGVQEYADLQYTEDGSLVGIQKRCYAYIKHGQWHLLTGYKVGNLITEWIGQVQADPQIIGYIEGAPPVPSENLTITSVGHYEASSIELVEADSVNYIYSSSRQTGFDMEIALKAGIGVTQQASGGIGLETQISDLNSVIGMAANFESSQGNLSEASTSFGYNTTKTSQLKAVGGWEKIGSEINAYVGRRYIPKNMGLALVQSDTMDVFALRLAHNNALVAYRYLPNPDIPKDWNIISFPINSTYTKQGTLDGKIGLKEDGSIQTDPSYPSAMNYGQWSYFKPIEAYSIKKRIERERQELGTYYNQYSTFQNVSFQASGLLADSPGNGLATRNLANTYVWTADGGFFSESTDVMEATTETTTGQYSFKGMAGLSMNLNLKLGPVVTALELDALFGGHIETTKSKGRETEKSFSLAVEVTGERDIQLYALTDAMQEKYAGSYNVGEGGVYDAQGNPVKQPGKVDAYRFMTFYLEPTTNNFEDFFGKVVDPIWLEQSSEANAIALRQANQGEKKPSCWRVFHRVTFVSRILPEIEAKNVAPLEKAIRAANIESNWELIKKIEPFVQTKTQDFAIFADAVREAIATYLPELRGYEREVIQYMALYFGLDEVTS